MKNLAERFVHIVRIHQQSLTMPGWQYTFVGSQTRAAAWASK
jgi:hypothetical protein